MDRPFQGFGLTGYDNVKREFVGIWLDNMGTGIQLYTGQEDAKGVQTFTSEFVDPASGRTIPSRSVGKVIDKNHHTYESYMTQPDGSEILHMRVEYRRVGA